MLIDIHSLTARPFRGLHPVLLFGCSLLPVSVAMADEAEPSVVVEEEADDGLRLNSATVEEFSEVDGVDEALAMRIVELRDERGGLGSVEALRILDIDGTTLDNLRSEAILEFPISSSTGNYTTPESVLQEFDDEPDAQATQAMAMTYSMTNPELVEGWLQASRRAYMLPKVNLQWEMENDQGQDFEYTIDDDGDLISQLDSLDLDNDDKFVIKLEWRLDKLVMSSEQIRVINEAQDIVKLRDRVLDEVTRLYFDRRRLQVDILLDSTADLRSRIENELRLQELTANLDALTGGAFSAALPR